MPARKASSVSGPYAKLRKAAGEALAALDEIEDLVMAGEDRESIISAAMRAGSAMGFEVVVDDEPEEATNQAMEVIEALREKLEPLSGGSRPGPSDDDDDDDEVPAEKPPPLELRKGSRYRVKSGKDAGKLGVLFWVGDGKFGGAMRVGLKDGKDTIWADAGVIEPAE
ncbi:MAG: hypothetical protein JNM17_24860 [Archangium sp.]|nr:hypothetical protein [Archangium sp.]